MAVAFKEWALVCEAMGRGEQSVILRKGGIAEGKGGFGFDHPEFYLFPTRYHGQLEKVRVPGALLPESSPDRITISHAVSLEWTGRIDDLEVVRRLEPLHILAASVIEERFVYDTHSGSLGGTGIHVAFVRMHRLKSSLTLPMEKGFGGCRSWIDLPGIVENLQETTVPVLCDEDHIRRREDFARALGDAI
jgi:hypothetical protein